MDQSDPLEMCNTDASVNYIGQSPIDILEEVYNYTSFLPGQEAAVKQIAAGIDTVVVIPTGDNHSID